MSHALFDRHRVLATTDLEQARQKVGERFCPHGLSFTRPGGRLDMVHNSHTVARDVSLHYLRYGDEVRIVPGRFETFFLVQIPLAGTARVQVGNRTVHSNRHRGSVESPTEPVDMVWSSDCEQLVLYIHREAIESLASSTAGPAADRSGPVIFDPLLDLNAATIRDWMQVVRLATDAVESRSTLLDSPLAAHSLEQTIIGALLTGQPNSASSAPPTATMSSRTLRRAIDIVQDEPERAWRVPELAALVDVSARTLQDAFSRELGSTPLKYVRDVRLERARRDLLAAAQSDRACVTEIAYRWGFYHLSRFAQAYRRKYSELPSQTLATTQRAG